MVLQPRLTGQGQYRWFDLPWSRRADRHLWNHVRPPSAQNTLIVYKDGSVVEGRDFTADVTSDPNVHRVFRGGYLHLVDDDDFSWNALAAAGYRADTVAADVYTPDYTDQYPQESENVLPDPAEAAEAVRLARIAALEAELALLRGTP